MNKDELIEELEADMGLLEYMRGDYTEGMYAGIGMALAQVRRLDDIPLAPNQWDQP